MTAVEWLEQILKQSCGKDFTEGYKQLFNKAKEMEKEQIITAYNRKVPFKFGKEYYNETFNNED